VSESLVTLYVKAGVSEPAGLGEDGKCDGPGQAKGGWGDDDREGQGVASGVALNVNDVLDGVLTFVPGFLIPPKVKTSASEAARPLGPKGKGDPVDRAAEPKKVTGETENSDPWL
jgi:hypothetical protein